MTYLAYFGSCLLGVGLMFGPAVAYVALITYREKHR